MHDSAGSSTGESIRGRARLCLYVVRGDPVSDAAVERMHRIASENPGLIADLRIIDIGTDPARAVQRDIFVTPVLERVYPLPTRRLLGLPGETSALLSELGIATPPTRHSPPTPTASPAPRSYLTEATMSELLDAISVGLAVIGDQRTIAYMNTALKEMTGRGDSGSPSCSLEDLVVQADVKPLVRHLQSSLTIPGEIEVQLGSGAEPIPVRLRFFELSGGSDARMGVAVSDLRELYRLQEHIIEISARETRILEEANLRLRAAAQAKDAFFMNMSHELRTPLNSIIGFSGLMLSGMAGDLTEEQRGHLELVNHSGRHLLSLIQDILDLAKLTSDQVALEVSDVDALAVVHSAVDGIRPLAVEKELALELELPDNPGTLRTDQRRLEQVLINLVSNAVKYTQRGSVTVSIEAEAHDHLLFSVRDTGPGIPDEALSQIFGEFVQLPGVAGRKNEGTGLGLAISRSIATLLGGTLGVESVVGAGSVFTLRVPRALPEDAGTPTGEDAPHVP